MTSPLTSYIDTLYWTSYTDMANDYDLSEETKVTAPQLPLIQRLGCLGGLATTLINEQCSLFKVTLLKVRNTIVDLYRGNDKSLSNSLFY